MAAIDPNNSKRESISPNSVTFRRAKLISPDQRVADFFHPKEFLPSFLSRSWRFIGKLTVKAKSSGCDTGCRTCSDMLLNPQYCTIIIVCPVICIIEIVWYAIKYGTLCVCTLKEHPSRGIHTIGREGEDAKRLVSLNNKWTLSLRR